MAQDPLKSLIKVSDALACGLQALDLAVDVILNAFPGGTIVLPGGTARRREDQPLVRWAEDIVAPPGTGLAEKIDDWLHGDSDVEFPLSKRGKDRKLGDPANLDLTTQAFLRALIQAFVNARLEACLTRKALKPKPILGRDARFRYCVRSRKYRPNGHRCDGDGVINA